MSDFEQIIKMCGNVLYEILRLNRSIILPPVQQDLLIVYAATLKNATINNNVNVQSEAFILEYVNCIVGTLQYYGTMDKKELTILVGNMITEVLNREIYNSVVVFPTPPLQPEKTCK